VLAVDENLRYGPVKAGYHGGGSPAEAVVPVAVLVPGAVPEDTDLVLAPPQEPAWWLDPVAAEPVAEASPSSPAVSTPSTDRTVHRQGTAAVPRKRPDEAMATLFDEPDADIPPEGRKPQPATAPSSAQAPAPAPAPEPTAPESAAARVLKSPVYAVQKRIAGRVSVTDQQVRALLSALLAAPGRRLAPAAAATALQVAPVLLRGAVLHVQRLLNVEGYAVLRVDADGATLILDDALLKEQYGI
jgi:pyruvate/2-oxoglutarate dehydrogenase complex dihydrolipoamide acyltransferase (E2) component